MQDHGNSVNEAKKLIVIVRHNIFNKVIPAIMGLRLTITNNDIEYIIKTITSLEKREI